MPSDKRARLRREWRADRKDLNKRTKWRQWTPTMFNDLRANLRKWRKGES